jgi:hypothetical protein
MTISGQPPSATLGQLMTFNRCATLRGADGPYSRRIYLPESRSTRALCLHLLIGPASGMMGSMNDGRHKEEETQMDRLLHPAVRPLLRRASSMRRRSGYAKFLSKLPPERLYRPC